MRRQTFRCRTSDLTWFHLAGYHLIGCQKLFNPAVSEYIEYIERNIYKFIYIYYFFPKFDVFLWLKCVRSNRAVLVATDASATLCELL